MITSLLSRAPGEGFGAALRTRPEVLLFALTVTLGTQIIRAFFPLLVNAYGARPGVTSMGLGLLAIGLFATAALSAIPVRLLGARRALLVTAGALALARLGAQFAPPMAAFWFTALGVVAFAWTLPVLLAVLRGTAPEAATALGGAFVLGLALEVTLSGLFWSWDPIWQRTFWAYAAALVLLAIYVSSLRGVAYVWFLGRLAEEGGRWREQTDAPGAWTLAGLAPLLFLHLIVFHNTARLTAVTGWPFPAALLFILLIDVLALIVMERLTSAGTIVLAGLVMIPTAYLAHGAGAGAAASWAVGSLASAVVAAAVLGAQGRGALKAGLAHTAGGWGTGMFLLVVAIFLYYIAYERRLPFENAVLVPVLAAIAALAALGGPHSASAPRDAATPLPWRIPRAALLLLVPVLLWITARPPQPVAGTGFPIRVMSFNLHQAIDINGRHDLEAFARAIEASGAEVLAVQEVSRGWLISGSTEMLTWLSRRLGMVYVWSPAADAVFGNAVLSRRPLAFGDRVAFPRGAAPIRRGGLRAEVDLGGGARLAVIGVHFHNQRVLDLPADELRAAQAQALAAFWNRQDRTVVMGDLNSVPESAALAVLKEAGLRDTFERGGGEPPGLTFLEFGRPVRRIDYILVSPDLTAREFITFSEALSDHLGVAVTISP